MALREPSPSRAQELVVPVAGGRVAVAAHGDPYGAVVFLLHGTPASRVGFKVADAPARVRGLRVLCPDRAGIGGSDPRPDRSVTGYADELLELADALGVGEFAVVGYSGGGPYALACAAGCGPRITAAALMAGIGPLDRPGALDELAPSDRKLLHRARHHPWLAGLQLRLEAAATRWRPQEAVAQIAAELSAPDRDFLARQDPTDVMAFFVEALRQGPAGVMVDYRLVAGPWNLGWSAIRVPVQVFQGDADRSVPMSHAEDILFRLPRAVACCTAYPGSGTSRSRITSGRSSTPCVPDMLLRTPGARPALKPPPRRRLLHADPATDGHWASRSSPAPRGRAGGSK